MFSPLVVHTTPEHDELKAIAADCITRHHSHHYLGFAATQWKLFRKEDPPRVKPLLYVYRVLLTGIHLMRTGHEGLPQNTSGGAGVSSNPSSALGRFALFLLRTAAAVCLCLAAGSSTVSAKLDVDALQEISALEDRRSLGVVEHARHEALVVGPTVCARFVEVDDVVAHDDRAHAGRASPDRPART